MQLHELGDFAGAEEAARRALRREPRETVAMLMLGELAIERRDWDRAGKILRRAVALAPGDGFAFFTLGRAYHLSNRLDMALNAYRRATELAPDLAIAHCNFAILLFDSDRAEEAWAAGLRAVELDPSQAAAHMTIGRALLQLEHIGPAEVALRRALALEANLPHAHIALSRALQRGGDFAQAVAHAKSALALDPELPQAWSALGLAHRAMGRFGEAVDCFRRALSLAPDFAEAHRDLAMCQKAAASEEELAEMRRTRDDAQLPMTMRVAAAFGLGKFHDDVEAHDEAFRNYAEGNRLTRAVAAADGIGFDLTELRAEIDEAVATFTPEFFAARAGWGSDSALPVFVVGLFRSGTTLTEQILASHARVHGAGELPDMRVLARKMAKPPGRAFAWTEAEVAEAAQAHLARLTARAPSADRIIDKHPENLFATGVIATLFPNARIICLHRDPRDNVLSCFFQRFAEEMAFATDLVDCGLRWLENERMAAHWSRVLPGRFYNLQYEALVDDLEAEARRVVDFIGLEWDPACLEFFKTERAVNTPSTWQVRQPIYASSRGRWKHYERHLAPLIETLAAAEAI